MNVIRLIKTGQILNKEEEDGPDEGQIGIAAAWAFFLAYLWASENDHLEPIDLDDPPKSAQIDQILREFKEKHSVPRDLAMIINDGNLRTAEGWALFLQSIV